MGSAMVPVSAKLRSDERDAFVAACERIGTSPSNAIRMFVSAFNRRGGFPFDPVDAGPVADARGEAPRRPADRERVLREVARAAADFPAIRRAYLFGSCARGSQTPESDVDVRLEIDRSEEFSLRDLSRFMKRVEQATGREVDVVSADVVKNERLAQAIEREKVLAYEREEQ